MPRDHHHHSHRKHHRSDRRRHHSKERDRRRHNRRSRNRDRERSDKPIITPSANDRSRSRSWAKRRAERKKRKSKFGADKEQKQSKFTSGPLQDGKGNNPQKSRAEYLFDAGLVQINTSGVPADSVAMDGEEPKTLLDH